MTAHHRPLQIVKITCFCIHKIIIRVNEFACHDAFSQNATHAFGEDYSLASCTVISEQLGPRSVVAAAPLLSPNRELTATHCTFALSQGILHRDYCSIIPTFSNSSALLTAHLCYTSHHNSTRTTGLSQQRSWSSSQAYSTHPTWPHARNIFCMDPTHHKPIWCATCSRVSDFGRARPQDPHRKCPFLPWPEHHHLLRMLHLRLIAGDGPGATMFTSVGIRRIHS